MEHFNNQEEPVQDDMKEREGHVVSDLVKGNVRLEGAISLPHLTASRWEQQRIKHTGHIIKLWLN